MRYRSKAADLHREVLVRVARTFFEGSFPDALDRIPLEMRPLRGASSRCCVHRDRAVIKYRCMAILGFSVEAEQDELTPLSAYGRRALARGRAEAPVITFLDEACHACIRATYLITNACHGCLAQPCVANCPKQAIVMEGHQARIEPARCVNCGICAKVCPYHAVVRVPIPCEEACPVGAIAPDAHGKEDIDYAKCIFCGKCVAACPFRAVLEKSELIDVLRLLAARSVRVVAMVAPAVVGQFNEPAERLAGALLALGFDAVAEVAAGADRVAAAEADEFVHRVGSGQAFMTSSCCPAFTEAVRKHVPECRPFVSSTPTPLHVTADELRRREPGSKLVFVGPCVAKRKEGLEDPGVDHVLTFEELAALLEARGIVVAQAAAGPLLATGRREGRGFAVTGGVRKAVEAYVGGRCALAPVSVDGLDAAALRQLGQWARGACPGNFVEVMGCAGGCVAGPGVVADPARAARAVEGFARATEPGAPATSPERRGT